MTRGEEGQGLVEYASILVLIAIVAMGLVGLLGPQVGAVYCDIIHAAYGSCPETCTDADMPDNACKHDEACQPMQELAAMTVADNSILGTTEPFLEAIVEQSESLDEVAGLLEEALHETLEAPFEYALQTGDEQLAGLVSAVIQASEDGDYQEVVAHVFEWISSGGELPPGVLVASVSKHAPNAIDACVVLNQQQISYALFSEARQAIASSGRPDLADEMDELWVDIEARNALIEDTRQALRLSAGYSIGIMEDFGNAEDLALAAEFAEQLEACGN